jgi:cyclase
MGGAFVTWNLAGELLAQVAPEPDAIAQMRKAMGGITPVTSKLTDQIHVISGPGGNIGVLIWNDGKLAVDSGVAGASDAILGQISALGPQPLRVLINTHWHFDHTDGNESFRKSGALVIAHENVRKRMGNPQEIDFFHAHIPPSPSMALPQQTFASETTLDLDDQQVRVFHVDPAHTDSDSIIHFVNSNVIHGGDLVFSGFFPFVDYSTGGKINGMIQAADRIIGLSDTNTKIIPGHGPVIGIDYMKRYRDMMADVRDAVLRLKNQGKDLDAIIAAKPADKYSEVWGKGMLPPSQFVRVIYSSL